MDMLGFTGALFLAYFIFQGFLAWLSIQAYLGVQKRIPIDLSDRGIVPTGKTKESIEKLEALGFGRLGEATVRLPFAKMRPIWILVNSDHSIQAESIADRVSFSTFFGENVLVATNYPNGEHLQSPTYQCRTITTSIEDALDYHRLQVQEFSRKFGPPHQILNMGDYIRWEVMGRVNYGRIVLKRFFNGGVAQLVISVFGIATIAAAFCLSWILRPAVVSGDATQTAFAASAGLVMMCPVIFLSAIALVVNLWLRYGSRRDSRKMKKTTQ